ncbi:MAG: hypothetical protein ACK5YO_00560, partial [Planctomyces sp.]
MGLENREYMQDEFSDGAGFGSRPRPRLSAVAQIIVITITVFLLQLLTVSEQSDFAGLLRDSSVESWLRMDGESVLSLGQVWSLATYALCHNR